jgi:hypothetical protein
MEAVRLIMEQIMKDEKATARLVLAKGRPSEKFRRVTLQLSRISLLLLSFSGE